MKNKLTKIEKEIKQLRKIKGNVIHVSNSEWYSLFKDEIRNSIAIEGIFVNRQELIDVLERNKRTDKHRAASILGYFDAASTMYEYAVNQYKENEFSVRMADVKQIHTLLMRYEKDMGFYTGELGEFRKTRIEVAHSTFSPINEFYVRQSMELLVEWINYHLKEKTYDPSWLGAIFHVWFESIHPFRDGNGRVGRILLSYILIGCGLINISIKGITQKNREQYYDILEKADDQLEQLHRKIENGKQFNVNDVDHNIDKNYFLEFVSVIIDRLEYSVNRIKRINLNDIDQEALIPLRDLAKIYDYSQDYLRNLINRGKLKGTKKGKIWYVKIKDIVSYVEKINSKS